MRKSFQTCICLLLAICISICGLPTAFAQENLSQVEQNQLAVLSALSIMQGYPDGTFRPDNLLTRAEFAKIAVAASSYRNAVPETGTTSPYLDVKYTHWASGYITVASKNGLITGYPDATFRPDQTVTVEEVVTIALRILGYTDEDFGSSWPYGQMGKAAQLGLLQDTSLTTGQPVSRRDALNILYRVLDTTSKGGSTKYLSTFQYTIVEDVTLIATAKEDSPVPQGKILTSAGTYTLGGGVSSESLYQSGDVLLSLDDNTIRLFMPQEQTVQAYCVYNVLGSDILVLENGSTRTLDLEDDTAVYYKSQKTDLKTVLPNIETGSELYFYYDGAKELQFVRLETQKLQGPVTATGGSLSGLVDLPDLANAVVVRDSKPATLDDIQPYDILYYSKSLNYIWAYCNKVTGIYENATPNKDMLTSVVVSGKTYTVDSTAAFEKLSSGGSFAYGDTVTLLLGKDGTVADVIPPDGANTVRSGYVLETGQKTYTNPSGGVYSSYYVRLATADGTEVELPAIADYKNYKCAVVSVSIEDGAAKLSRIGSSSGLSGKVDASAHMLGTTPIADDVKILDVGCLESYRQPKYVSVFLQRLNGVSLTEDDILQYSLNGNGEVEELYLKRVTGDYDSYGVVIDAKISGGGMSQYGTYKIDIDGTTSTFTPSGTLYLIESGSPARFSIGTGNQPDSITALHRVSSPLTSVTSTTAFTESAEYPLSSKVVVYDKTGNQYMKIPLESIDFFGGKTVYAYYDKEPSRGGCVRVIVVSDIVL